MCLAMIIYAIPSQATAMCCSFVQDSTSAVTKQQYTHTHTSVASSHLLNSVLNTSSSRGLRSPRPSRQSRQGLQVLGAAPWGCCCCPEGAATASFWCCERQLMWSRGELRCASTTSQLHSTACCCHLLSFSTLCALRTVLCPELCFGNSTCNDSAAAAARP